MLIRLLYKFDIGSGHNSQSILPQYYAESSYCYPSFIKFRVDRWHANSIRLRYNIFLHVSHSTGLRKGQIRDNVLFWSIFLNYEGKCPSSHSLSLGILLSSGIGSPASLHFRQSYISKHVHCLGLSDLVSHWVMLLIYLLCDS